MNTAYTLIRRHCHNQLVERGWPDDLDIETNLSYCQGDGVAFYGRIHTCCILKLLPELAGRGYLSEQDWREVDDCIG
ncbi:NgrC, partial [Escherichia coli]|nr:NgrC [Escherichia coli]